MLGLAQRIANATTTKKCYGLASSPFRVASERAIEPWGRGGGGGGGEEELSFSFPHLALACHLRVTTLMIDTFQCHYFHYFTRIIKLHLLIVFFLNS